MIPAFLLGLPLKRIGLIAGAAVVALAIAIPSIGWKIEARRADKLDKQLASYRVALGQARAEKGRIEAVSRKIAEETEKRHNEEVSRIRAAAGALSLRGPGAARCAPAVAAPARQGVPGAAPGAAVAPVPDGAGSELIGLPFPEAVRLAQNHDNMRAEVLAWREWHARLAAEWPKK